jgi:hypothetical protein
VKSARTPKQATPRSSMANHIEASLPTVGGRGRV